MHRAWICRTCGVQYSPSAEPPSSCPICEDERQYVGWNGQQWTTLDEMRADHTNVFSDEEPSLTSIQTSPAFGIGQRAFLVRTPAGNVLWDSLSLIDDETINRVRSLGGIAAIAISHPHYYSSMTEWSHAFGEAPIYIHTLDRQWVARPEAKVRFWSGASENVIGNLNLIHCGGHFNGFQVLHWPDGADGRGVLLAGDQPQVAMDRKSVSFLYSYPNMIPLGPAAIRQILASLEPWPFDRQYGAFAGRTIASGAKESIRRSADRYLRFIAQ